ncbi:MAG TPA: 2-amino-4-hydroxy-6-hydroxymethyldihydropteridine diphosphokinase [Acetobacteraceae bacterium]|nr:2-amino-4-hydroxy-6-hydroxymethyldihydropteridine diphosphokinase [Acetobacteraceae bacterium]
MSSRCQSASEGPILVAIGANLPDPRGAKPLETCRAAAAALDGLPGLRLVALSRWWASAPIPAAEDQPDYVNGVARLDGETTPEALLQALQAIERRAGRQPARAPNAARPLDLDIIAIGPQIRHSPDPILPHPRAHLRAFVLAPLAEVAPGWAHPILGQPAAALLATLPPQLLRPLGL